MLRFKDIASRMLTPSLIVGLQLVTVSTAAGLRLALAVKRTPAFAAVHNQWDKFELIHHIGGDLRLAL